MKNAVLRTWILFVGILFSFNFLTASEPDGYYQSAYGKGGYTLKTALHKIIKDHTTLSYDGLYTAYQKTDVKDGHVWDMYSSCNFSFSNKCGNYENECDCYNREHSFPKSWFGGKVKPMYTDIFHLYPTDGKVNGMRSSNPFGEVGSPTYTSKNGSKLGKNTTSGYSGVVFEPIDEYKGDFARTYFYMATCYEDKIANWGSCPICAGNNKASFKQWAVDLLLKWHRQDPVSQKERDRNDAAYNYQHNRNPFIDHPELVEKIWGSDNTVFDPADPNPPVNPDPDDPDDPNNPDNPDPDEPEDPDAYTTYEIWYEYHDAQGEEVSGSDNMLTIKVPNAKGRTKAAEGTVLMDEDFPSVDGAESGPEASVENTGSTYVQDFSNVYLYGKSAVRLASSKNPGEIVFKEFNASGNFTVTVSGKGWGSGEKGFTLECEGCTQASQEISFTKSKEDLKALDQYEELAPVTLTANGKAKLTISAAKKSRVMIDRVRVTAGGETPDNPDLTGAYGIKVLHPVANDTVRKADVTARVAVVDEEGTEISRYTLKKVELPDTGAYTFWTNLWKDEEELDEQSVKFVYALPQSGDDNGDDNGGDDNGDDNGDDDDPNVGVEVLTGAEFLMYPNPTTGSLTLEMLSDDNLVEIFSVKGTLVLRRRHVGERFETTLNRAGVYFVRVTNIYGGSVRRIVVR
ncbi:MAG: endonuclease [Bacteroides sp.]|nr:endonuclease [Bacteroides sp.]MCM1086294.1 endonuclease [Bacteroides sp.]